MSSSREARSSRTEAPAGETGDLFELISGRRSSPTCVEGLRIGTLAALGPSDEVEVAFSEAPGGVPIRARSTVPLEPRQVGAQVVLAFERGDPGCPIVLGLLQSPIAPLRSETEPQPLEIDVERLMIDARSEIVLRCGKATITLTRDGKVRIRGADLVSRSSGTNRIKGGSVSIN